MLKEDSAGKLPHGRGSVSGRKQAIKILSRARKQALFGLFQHPSSCEPTSRHVECRRPLPSRKFGRSRRCRLQVRSSSRQAESH